jgi:hypothetical protein
MSNIVSKKLKRVFLMLLGVAAVSITCVNSASANETVSVNATTPYRDYQVYSTGGSYEIRVLGSDPVVQLYRGTSIARFDGSSVQPSGDFLAVDDDSGGSLPDRSSGVDSKLSGTFANGLGNYIIRVTSFLYWAALPSPTQSYTLRYTGFYPGAVQVNVRQTSNLTFAQSLYASDTLSDEDGELRKTVDQIMNKYGSLIK